MVTNLENAIWDVAEPIRATRFGQILQRAWSTHRSPDLPGPDEHFHGWELSFDPAIQRTFGAAIGVAIEAQTNPDMTTEWFLWNMAAKRAACRMAAKCWAGIDSQRRRVFVDEDNFQPIWGQPNLYDLRSDTLGAHLDFEGLNNPEVRVALAAVYKEARATPAYEAALRADRDLERSRDLLIAWALIAAKGHKNLGNALRSLPIGEGQRHGREIVRTTYAGTPVEEIAGAFQRYNQLVQRIIWSILGLAEIATGPYVLTEPIGTLRCTRSDVGSPFIRVSTENATNDFLRCTHPVRLETGTPLDGVHTLVGYTMAFASATTIDLSLEPISWFAGLWPACKTFGPERVRSE